MTSDAVVELENKFENGNLQTNRTLDNATTHGLQTYNDIANQLQHMDYEIHRLSKEIDTEKQKYGMRDTAHNMAIM